MPILVNSTVNVFIFFSGLPTEIITSSITTLGPALPEDLESHCSVIFEDKLWVIGGHMIDTEPDTFSYKSFILNGDMWQQGPALIEGI